jgi:hypothetical protein
MKKTLIAAALFAVSFAASAQLAYPGSNWSTLTFNPSVIKGTPEDNNILLQGKLEQGVVWAKFGNYRVNTYGSVAYSWDRNGLSYNNKVVPAIGVKLQRTAERGVFDIGVELAHQNNFRGVQAGAPKSGTGVIAYAQYWFGWDLK